MNINPISVNWLSEENECFTPPHQSHLLDIKTLKSLDLSGHLFVMTSGRYQQKIVALSKKAFLHSAKAVNQHLKVQKKDRWLVTLPLFHVGGLSILARSFLSDSLYFINNQKWNPVQFSQQLKEHQIAFTSLVPAQVYDLIFLKIRSPSCLKAIVVGGGKLHPHLYQKAREFNWPLLPSYGLTEMSSQVATAELNSLNQKEYPQLLVLPHCQVRIHHEKIQVKSPALLTGWMDDQKSFQIHKEGDWWETKDQGIFDKPYLQVFGQDRLIKILGEKVSLDKLENQLLKIQMDQNISGEYQLLATPHERTEYQIDLVTNQTDKTQWMKLKKYFNQQVLPFERMKNCYVLPALPKGTLSKIQITKLKQTLGFPSS